MSIKVKLRGFVSALLLRNNRIGCGIDMQQRVGELGMVVIRAGERLLSIFTHNMWNRS
jgi:hypothetical protein